ncbi:hypothetical protein BDB00DRAFT_802503 [Zychaea mexicana]|uniref:uncharacterized protein n=1 Tax=Zychaea mexicana TaxID=64656 RepID=UPI0022FEC106|nr:uncharacterized protein BDB00DRAFT_802503 [Zychaea mexicana]KAI9497910.1 hypothetical protein BDB00DRAFT_802503 [Zychaea mexicana]
MLSFVKRALTAVLYRNFNAESHSSSSSTASPSSAPDSATPFANEKTEELTGTRVAHSAAALNKAYNDSTQMQENLTSQRSGSQTSLSEAGPRKKLPTKSGTTTTNWNSKESIRNKSKARSDVSKKRARANDDYSDGNSKYNELHHHEERISPKRKRAKSKNKQEAEDVEKALDANKAKEARRNREIKKAVEGEKAEEARKAREAKEAVNAKTEEAQEEPTKVFRFYCPYKNCAKGEDQRHIILTHIRKRHNANFPLCKHMNFFKTSSGKIISFDDSSRNALDEHEKVVSERADAYCCPYENCLVTEVEEKMIYNHIQLEHDPYLPNICSMSTYCFSTPSGEIIYFNERSKNSLKDIDKIEVKKIDRRTRETLYLHCPYKRCQKTYNVRHQLYCHIREAHFPKLRSMGKGRWTLPYETLYGRVVNFSMSCIDLLEENEPLLLVGRTDVSESIYPQQNVSATDRMEGGEQEKGVEVAPADEPIEEAEGQEEVEEKEEEEIYVHLKRVDPAQYNGLKYVLTTGPEGAVDEVDKNLLAAGQDLLVGLTTMYRGELEKYIRKRAQGQAHANNL